MITKEELYNNPALSSFIVNRDCDAIAKYISINRVKTQSTLIGMGTILDVLGPDAGAALLDSLESAATSIPAIKYGLRLLENSNLDISLTSVKDQFDKLVQMGILNVTDAETLKSLADVPDPVTPRQIAEILYNDDGSAK